MPQSTAPTSSLNEHSIPLIVGEDSFSVVVRKEDTTIMLLHVLRFPGNSNVSPTHERYFDLNAEERRGVIAQINRRFSGCVVQVTK